MINTENIDVLELFDEFETKLEHGVQSGTYRPRVLPGKIGTVRRETVMLG